MTLSMDQKSIELCDGSSCTGCKACVAACPVGAVRVEHGLLSCVTTIDRAKCISCGRCVRACPQLNPVSRMEPVNFRQGWASSQAERATSSSGGVCAAISRAFAQTGGKVCSCVLDDGRFTFTIVDRPEYVDQFKGSKYVKSDALPAYSMVKDALRDGFDVLFVGMPCQVAALRRAVGSSLEERLYTIDFVCHGTPSVATLERFLSDRGLRLADMESLSFRSKARFGIRDTSQLLGVSGVVDSYLIAFLNGLSYTENCYACPYAGMGRVSDLTVGDSWGTDLKAEMPKGVSLVLCQTEKGQSLIDSAGLELHPVDVANAIANNQQLSVPSARPAARDKFLSNIAMGKTFDRCVRACLPMDCVKQDVKRLLIRLGLRGGRGAQ